MNYYIFQNPDDIREPELKKEITENLPNIVTDPIQADLIIVLGGDGTMLDAIHKLYQHNKPFFGVNCGTLGFLLNNVNHVNQIPNQLDNIEIISEPFINVEVIDKQGKTHNNKAINDIVIGGNRSDWINTSLGDSEEVNKYQFQGSGVLISSPIGSTGTWLSEGKTILPVGKTIIGIKGLSSAPFDRKIDSTGNKIIANIESRSDITTFIDGKYIEIPHTSKITVQSSEEIFTLCFIKPNNTSTFENKRMQLYAKKLGNIF